MSAKQFLLCDSVEHAAFCDLFCCAFFQDRDGNCGGNWSGVFARPGLLSDTYAILWDSQLSAIFGDAEDLPIEAEVIDDNGDSNWLPLPEPDPEVLP